MVRCQTLEIVRGPAAVGLLVLWSSLLGGAPMAVAANVYAEGQVWEYDTRKADAGSLIRIMRIDDLPRAGRMIHICVVGLKLPYPAGPGGILAEVPELPMTPAAMDASVRRLSTRKATCTRFANGYKIWRQEYDQGQIGTVTIPLKAMMERIAAKAKQSQTP
jgi:hypothetical protein